MSICGKFVRVKYFAGVKDICYQTFILIHRQLRYLYVICGILRVAAGTPVPEPKNQSPDSITGVRVEHEIYIKKWGQNSGTKPHNKKIVESPLDLTL